MTNHERLVEQVRGILMCNQAPSDHKLAELLVTFIKNIQTELPKPGQPVMVKYHGEYVLANVTAEVKWGDEPGFVTDITSDLYIAKYEGIHWRRVTFSDIEKELNKLKEEHGKWRAASTVNGANLELELAKEKVAKDNAQAALKVYKDSFKELHDYVMKKYPVNAFGKDITEFTISLLETPVTTEQALEVLKKDGWEVGTIIKKGELLGLNHKSVSRR